jgi:hypothetical protein
MKTSHCAIAFRDFVWESKKLPNFFIFEKLFSFLFRISWFGYLKRLHVEFSSNLSLVWMKIEFLEISSAILYGKFTLSLTGVIKLKIFNCSQKDATF